LNVLFVELFGMRTPHRRNGADPPAIAMDMLLGRVPFSYCRLACSEGLSLGCLRVRFGVV
jgi:hypothetical protein